jgi:hypothetical protein
VGRTRRSVSNPKESMTGNNPLTRYSGVPATGPSLSTCPRRLASDAYTAATASLGPTAATPYTGSINLGAASRNAE